MTVPVEVLRHGANSQRDIAHRLLIELLACQFAFPVKWIETQDDLFSREETISRFIEIGPASVLVEMAKQTAGSKYADRDLAKSIKRQFSSSKSNEKDIYYEYEAFEEEQKDQPLTSEPELSTQSPAPIASSESKTLASSSLAPAAAVNAAPVADTPFSTEEIIRSLVARKVHKSFDELPANKSIKDVTGGKSTLQNELVGILENEFASLPGGPEDLAISQLAEEVRSASPGSLGKESSRLLSRTFSKLMPAGFGLNDARSHLELTWGLGNGRQTSVLLFAATTEPKNRLASAEMARDFLDSIVQRYATTSGQSLTKASSSGGPQGPISTMVDTKAIEELRKEQTDRLSKHFNVLADHLNMRPSDDVKVKNLETREHELRAKLDRWSSEFEEDFETGIRPVFDAVKLRYFDAWWNNVRQDLTELFHQMQMKTMAKVLAMDQSALDAKLWHIANRSDDFACQMMERLLCKASRDPSNNFQILGKELRHRMSVSRSRPPVFRYAHKLTAPQTNVTAEGSIKFTEVARQHNDVESYPQLLRKGISDFSTNRIKPIVHIKTRPETEWLFNVPKTNILLDTLDEAVSSGISFEGKTILITGAGPKSIGAEVLRGLLNGGARVIVTTSRQPQETKTFYENVYAECGARGSSLAVFPFNQGSKCDCEALIDHIYEDSGMRTNIDAILPFAAMSERGEIDGLEGRSELAHRLMMTNVLRMLGRIVRNKAARNINTRPTQVILPLSPNHGVFGSDGLYAESKLGLVSLLDKFDSESWSDYLYVCGAVIGWTRGTDLMAENDIVAQAIEARNALTFTQKEMALNLLALMSPSVAEMCETEPIWADLTGGLDNIAGLKDVLISTRAQLNHEANIRKAITAEDALEWEALHNVKNGGSAEKAIDPPIKRSTLRVGYPSLPDYGQEIAPLKLLEGMVDLSSVPVIVGFAELGPWGSSRTRWEMESRGEFSQDGYIEMAWMMNLIKFFDGEKDSQHYAGWVDAKTGSKVSDDKVPELYGPQILEHSGIRFVEPELFDGYDPNRKEFAQEVAIEEDMPEFDASRSTAEAFKLRHGENVSIRHVEGSEDFKVQLKRGATVMISKAVPFEGFVAGQIPTGWDATKYGLPEDIVKQVDPVTAYALCCAAEALYSAGISDATEILQHIHISEIGNFVGSMMGGTTKTRNMYRDRYLDKDVQSDVMQETYLNTTAAWINMLLLGTAGPIKTPTGACATGIESIDSACESLLSGKTKLCFVGGTDDFSEEESYAFRTMNATINANDQVAQGRLPSEMSRPMADTRSGFVEGQGSGMQIITTAELALRMGLPIYGVIAASTMAGDKISRSVPAPGQGVLSFARETPEARLSPLLNIDYRRSEMNVAVERVQAWRNDQLYRISVDRTGSIDEDGISDSQHEASRLARCSSINNSADIQIKGIRKMWGNDFRRQNPEISPLRAALATWGLTIDDIDVASLHGTSTKANDTNEPDIINKQMAHLRRTNGAPLLAICQKSVTGHPKAPAAAFMLNGCLQALNTGIVPGNRNADNVDKALSAFSHLTFPTRSIQTSSLKAFSMTSFGFGQKGGQLIGLHPRFIYGVIGRAPYEAYVSRVTKRTRLCDHAYLSALLKNRLVVCKTTSDYNAADQDSVFLDPWARVSSPASAGEAWRYDPENIRGDSHDASGDESDNSTTLYSPAYLSRSDSGLGINSPGKASSLGLSGPSSLSGSQTLAREMMKTKAWIEAKARYVEKDDHISVGVDVEENLTAIDTDLQSTFIQRNFTARERAAAAKSPDSVSSLTGKWSAKEAVFKSLGVEGKGAGAPMKDIEVLAADSGVPVAQLHGDAFLAAQEQGITDIQLSLSHSDETAIAVAIAIRGG